MPTQLEVVSSLTTIRNGCLQLEGLHDLSEVTVGAVKEMVQDQAKDSGEGWLLPLEKQNLWWRGYILDDDTKTLTQACIGVNEGERLDPDVETLRIFLTIVEPQCWTDDSSLQEDPNLRSSEQTISSRILGSNTFEDAIHSLRSEIETKKDQYIHSKFCIIL